MNKIFVTGRLTKDAELKVTQSGKQVTGFDLAVRDDFKPKEKDTLFLKCQLWGTRAEKLVQYLVKGKFIAITGRLDINKTEGKDGIKYCNHNIVVDDVEFLSSKEKVQPEQETKPGPETRPVED